METSLDSPNSLPPRLKPNPLQWAENTNLYIPYSAGRGSVSISEANQAGGTVRRYQSNLSGNRSKKCIAACVTIVGLAMIGLGAYSASTFEKGSRNYINFVAIAACGGIIITGLCLTAICKRWC